MGLSIEHYGIHGSKDENAIGKQVTQGCIRMRNAEVEQLYDLVPVGTEVVIVN
jgi:lipoprotein-anchoring transpeptidase ErfK/SrfK